MKTFKIAEVRDLLNQVHQEKITFSRFVEILNEKDDTPKYVDIRLTVEEAELLINILFHIYKPTDWENRNHGLIAARVLLHYDLSICEKIEKIYDKLLPDEKA